MSAPEGPDEQRRLASLRAASILDTPPEAAFDELADIAMAVFASPIALVSLVDGHRQWFKAARGIDARETPRDQAFCAHAILEPNEVLLVPDATQDPRFRDNPLVVGEPGIRFYAGAPLVDDDGLALGTLCVIDRVPRTPTSKQLKILERLARRVSSEISRRLRLLSVHRLESERDRAWLDLAESEQRLRMALEGGGMISWELDLSSGFAAWGPGSGAFLRVFGAKPDARLEDFLQRVHPDDRKGLVAEISALRDDGQVFETVFRAQHVDGSTRWLTVHGSAYRQPESHRRAFGVMYDISERRQQEEQLVSVAQAVSYQTGTAFLERLLENLTRVLQADYAFISERQPGQRMKVVAAVGQPYIQGMEYDMDQTPCFCVLENDLCTWPRQVQAAFPKDPGLSELGIEAYSGARLADSAGGSIGLLAVMFRRELESQRTAESMLRIYASRVAAELERVQHQEQLMAAKRSAEAGNQSKSEFLATMSHEIRTPMNAVIGFTELLGQTRLDAQQAGYVETIRSSGEALLSLIDDILDLSKVEAGRLEVMTEPFDPLSVCQQVADIVAPRASEKRVELKVLDGRDRSEWVHADEARFRQILLNLASNAIKFTHEGEVRLELGSRPEGFIQVTLHDTGIGIAEDVQARLFQPFVQGDASTTRRYGGTGLGLAISRKLVELMGGSIGVQSTPGDGSSFWFTVPSGARSPEVRLDRAAGLNAIAVRSASLMSKETPRVLLVEDNQVNQALAKTMLLRLGCEVTLAANGLQALDQFQRGPFDLVLMDCHMDQMDGFEATQEIRRRENGGPRVPIIALTASALESDRRRCREVGMDDFLAKPLQMRRLQSVLSNHLRA